MFQQEEPNFINNLPVQEGALFNFPKVPINFPPAISASNIPSMFSTKYRKRKDLTSEIRVRIGIAAAADPTYGKITALAQEYKISRTFIYTLRNFLIWSGLFIFDTQNVFLKDKPKSKAEKEREVLEEILVLRLEGKSPIQGISSILKRKGFAYYSTGYISQVLQQAGAKVSPLTGKNPTETYAVVYASDEVFSKSRPILITVDPVSSAMLHAEVAQKRDGDTWEEHWAYLLSKGVIPLYLSSDEGTGLKAGTKKDLKDTPFQADTFHACAHRLGDRCRILYQQACAAIGEEYERERVMNNRKEGEVKKKKTAAYEAAKTLAIQKIKLYEDFYFWYSYLIEQFQIFDDNGQVQSSKQAKVNLLEGMEGMKELEDEKANKELASLKKMSEDLFYFLDYAAIIVAQLYKLPIADTSKLIPTLCKAYQYQKKRIKTKKAAAKRYYAKAEQENLELAQLDLQQQAMQGHDCVEFDALKNYSYLKLDSIVQSSAMVETINSIVRTYFNVSKNQITQEQLNLIGFYHNHRRYVAGKRKGYTPMELLTGQQQEKDWLELLLEQL